MDKHIKFEAHCLSDSPTLLHIRVLLGGWKNTNGQALPQTNKIRILEFGTRH